MDAPEMDFTVVGSRYSGRRITLRKILPPMPTTKDSANSGMETLANWCWIACWMKYAMVTVTMMKPRCRASGSMDEGLVVAWPIEGCSDFLVISPERSSHGSFLGSVAVRPVLMPQLAKMMPPTMAAKVPTVAAVNPREDAS